MGDSIDKDKDTEPALKSPVTNRNNPDKTEIMDINNKECVQLSTNNDIKTKAPIPDESKQDSEYATSYVKSATNVVELSVDAAKSTTIAMDSSADATESASISMESSSDATKSAETAIKSMRVAMDSSADATESATIAMDSSADATKSLETATKSTPISVDSSADATESTTIAMESSADSAESSKTATKSLTVAMDSSAFTTESATIAMDSSADATKSLETATKSTPISVDSSADATESTTIAMESSADSTESSETATKSLTVAMDSTADTTESATISMDSSADATESTAIAMESSSDSTESLETATKFNTIAMDSSAVATESSTIAIDSSADAKGSSGTKSTMIAMESSASESVTNAINTSADSMEVEISADNSVYLFPDKLGPKIRIDSPKCFIRDPNKVLNYSKLNPLQSLYGKDERQGLYDLPEKYMTPPIIPKKLPTLFEKFLPIYPQSNKELDKKKALKEFVRSGLDDETFYKLEMYCTPENLKSGLDVDMEAPFPVLTNRNRIGELCAITDEGKQLNTVVKTQLRNRMDLSRKFRNGLAYRGVRFYSPDEEKNVPVNMGNLVPVDTPLVPGKDLIFKISIYKSFPYNPKKRIETVSRHPIFSHDLIMHGRQSLEVIRDQFRCPNDLGLRVDVSSHPYRSNSILTSCREIFPSAFLLMNNVFYDDTRPGCQQLSSVIREWAAKRGVGKFPARPLNGVQLQDLEIRLGYPEVFLHQGDCEHLFSFAQVRLVGPDDVLDPSQYPTHRILSSANAVYCTTCAEFIAKWIVVGSDRTPFDPAFLCETCFSLYLYRNDQKLGNFKAYPYIMNDACKY